MNKISFINDIINTQFTNDIKYDYTSEMGLNCLKIYINEDSTLLLNLNSDNEIKLEILIYVSKYKNVKILEMKTGNKIKIKYNYFLEENSIVNVEKFNDCNIVREVVNINLDGYNADFTYYLKTISTGEEKYDLIINHNKNNTISNIFNSGITTETGKITFNVTSQVKENIEDCIVNQNNKIINLFTSESTIKPILLIDECNVSANHSAYIGNFKKEEIFYLQSRGIDELTAKSLLIKGFLTENNHQDIDEIIYKYWG